MKTKISMTIEDPIFTKFRIYCKVNGYKISSRVEILMKRDLENADRN